MEWVSNYIYIYIYIYNCSIAELSVSRSQYPRGLRRRSTAARLLRLWGSNPSGGMDVRLL